MKNILKILLLLFVVGAFFNACQKDVVIDNKDEILLMEEAITLEQPLVFKFDDGPGGNTDCEILSNYLIAEVGFEDFVGFDESSPKFDDGYQYSGKTGPITWWTDDEGVDLYWESDVPVKLAILMKGGPATNAWVYTECTTSGGPIHSPGLRNGNIPALSNLQFCYTLCEDYPFCDGETAFGGDNEGGGAAWWYYYDNIVGGFQKIYAGQKEVPGASVIYDEGKIIIELGEYMRLIPGDETVKIKGYDDLPNSRPAAGRFTGEGTYKGTSLEVTIGEYNYYVIHLDVEVCWQDIPAE